MKTTSFNTPDSLPASVVGPLPGVEYMPGDLVADLDDQGKAALADANWVNEEYSKGTFDEFRGQYIAVVNKKVLGYGKNRLRLAESVAAETGIDADRIVTTLIFRKPLK